ncbi:ATP-dependent Clp protease ATP-binding subunit [Candidatus Saccharibacteria bacterium]|nr:ATP-dependent Clp protease ATP-binding subunit [Candidatus Saccharibacteria bacterium]MBR3377991.1 ATP-dependent Clp protease ATP-binding subunit [Candidatus Saccharibacteria bacterium]
MRSVEARADKILNSTLVKALLVISFITLIAFGGALLFFHYSIGWMVIGFAAIPFEFLIWAKYELKEIPIGRNNTINDLLSNECLARLGSHPTPQSIVTWFYKTRSGNFLAIRYSITPRMLEAITKDMPEDITPIFEKAIEIREKTESEVVSGGVLAVAIIECRPDCEQILKSMKLELSDLYDGLLWFNYLSGLVKGMRKRRHTGGFARDLMFGYTPLLQNYTVNISRQHETTRGGNVSISLHREQIQQMIDIFSKGGRQNVALIGPDGCGRSTIVNEFASEILNADNKISSQIKYRQIFKLDAAALISSASERGEMETLMNRILNEAYYAKNVILWLENAELFFEEGTGSIDISNVLLPILENGAVRVILTMDQQKFLEISSRKAALANALNKIMIEPADEEATIKVMQDRVPLLEDKFGVIYTFWSLRESYRLSERYVHDLVMPGRAISLLESAGNFPIDGYITDASVQQAIEKTVGVKMQSSTDEEDKSRLLNMEELIHKRLIGQDMAVRAVSDALRRAAAGVRNENRPIGTFLFLGPTGVGKTELAKAISEVYFGGEGTIIRIDLNEYVSADDVQRLIADGATDELSLTAQVMKHPFSVVLLDEIEKAHPLVLTTLLQLLDEGILRDVKNREVSFRDTIVVATSNAGANSIRDYIDQGLDTSKIKEQLTNDLISSGEFKPEFLNRFDEICIFQPLSKEALLSIVDLIIASTNKTLEPRKITVSLEPEAKTLLVEHGYDPKLGARPMRRIVSKTVENIVARAVLSGEADSGASITITPDMIQAALD